MKRLIIAALLCVGFGAHAQWYTGMSQKAGLALCIHLGDSTCELYSPMQTADPIPISAWSLKDDRLTIECKSIGLKIFLARHLQSAPKPGDEESHSAAVEEYVWQGYWKQSIVKEGITFYPTDTLFQMRRPQTPQQPYRFDEETVTADYTDSQGNKVHIEGTLTYPKGKGKFPTIVLVSGSGQQNRDEELLGHKPFLVLADYLTRQGIAVLRYDDRGVGGSTGDVENATTLDFADDVEAVFDFLRKQKHIDSKHVGIIGHSEGGLIAPIVASRNRKVAFVVLLAGPGTTGADILLQQNERLFQLDSVPQPLIERRLDLLRSLYAVMDTLPVDNYQHFTIALCDKYSEGLTADQRKSIGLRRGDAIGLATQMALPWMRTFIKLDNSTYLSQLRCPILAINGDKDCQVLPVNLQAIFTATRGRADLRLMPGLNHLMQHCVTGASGEYMLIDETMAPEVLQIVAEWVVQTCKTERNKK